MPLYEYDCAKCGRTVELLVRRADERAACPRCGSRALKRRLSSFAPGRARPDAGGGCDACPSAGGSGCANGLCGLN